MNKIFVWRSCVDSVECVFKTLELTLCRLSVSVWQVLGPPVPVVREDIYICK